MIAADLLEDFQTDYGAQLIGSTIARIRGRGAVLATGTGPEGVRVGGLVVQHEAQSLSQTDHGPFNSPHSDWFLYEPFCWIGSGGTDVSGRMIDNQAMRKLEEIDEQALLYVAGNAGNTVDVTISLDLSIGLKLP